MKNLVTLLIVASVLYTNLAQACDPSDATKCTAKDGRSLKIGSNGCSDDNFDTIIQLFNKTGQKLSSVKVFYTNTKDGISSYNTTQTAVYASAKKDPSDAFTRVTVKNVVYSNCQPAK